MTLIFAGGRQRRKGCFGVQKGLDGPDFPNAHLQQSRRENVVESRVQVDLANHLVAGQPQVPNRPPLGRTARRGLCRSIPRRRLLPSQGDGP